MSGNRRDSSFRVLILPNGVRVDTTNIRDLDPDTGLPKEPARPARAKPIFTPGMTRAFLVEAAVGSICLLIMLVVSVLLVLDVSFGRKAAVAFLWLRVLILLSTIGLGLAALQQVHANGPPAAVRAMTTQLFVGLVIQLGIVIWIALVVHSSAVIRYYKQQGEGPWFGPQLRNHLAKAQRSSGARYALFALAAAGVVMAVLHSSMLLSQPVSIASVFATIGAYCVDGAMIAAPFIWGRTKGAANAT